jgi:hypothetical protein
MHAERDALALALLGVFAGACGRLGYATLAGDGGGGIGGLTGSAAAGGGSGSGGIAGGTGGSIGGDGGQAIACNTLTYGAHQYAFCDALVDWATARIECEGRGMRLVRIDDDPENVWLLANAAFSASMFRRDALWLGGYEPTVDGDWHWTDGDAFWNGAANGMPVGGLYANWDTSEPNNAVGPEGCLAVSLNKTGWSDWGCANRHYFACEMY